MKKLLKQLFFVCLLATFGATWAQGASLRLNSPFYTGLKNKFQHSSYITSDPGNNRFYVMLFFAPDSQKYGDVGFWESVWNEVVSPTDEKIYALSLYLYHMYVTSAAYGVATAPKKLNTNYLGVTDGLDYIRIGFDANEAESFYESNKEEIKKQLAKFFKNISLKKLGLQATYNVNDAKNDAVEKAFLQTLKNSQVAEKNYYLFSAYSKVGNSLSAKEKARQQQWMNQGLKDINGLVCLYSHVQGGDYIAGKTRTDKSCYCRPAQDECAACTYYTCRRICQEAEKAEKQFNQFRLYTLEARPKTGRTLFSSGRNKKQFALANGTVAKDWGYHRATLVVYRNSSGFSVAVIDKFLFKHPVPLNEWLKRFDSCSTRLSIKLFMRNESVEENVVKPDHRKGNTVTVHGRNYQLLTSSNH